MSTDETLEAALRLSTRAKTPETLAMALATAAGATTAPIRLSSPAWRWHCHADPLMFISWEAVPATLQAQLQHLGTLPCHRNGVPGPWCSACPFGTSTTEGGL